MTSTIFYPLYSVLARVCGPYLRDQKAHGCLEYPFNAVRLERAEGKRHFMAGECIAGTVFWHKNCSDGFARLKGPDGLDNFWNLLDDGGRECELGQSAALSLLKEGTALPQDISGRVQQSARILDLLPNNIWGINFDFWSVASRCSAYTLCRRSKSCISAPKAYPGASLFISEMSGL